jgi:hypothetical protein
LKAKQEVDEIIAKKWEVDPKMFERAFEALQQAWVSKEYLQLLKWAGIEDLQVLKRYKFWLEHPRFKEHIEGIMELRNLTPTEAHTIFWYTNWVLRIPKTKTDFINWFVRWELKDLTEEQIKWLQDLVRAFDSWLDKMPNAPEKVLMRWDSAKRRQPWKPIELKWYTSVANNTNDTFVNRKDSLIEITTVPWRAKDISDLAAYKHFAKEMWEPEMATKHEWLILRNSQAVVESIEKDYLVNFRWKDYLKNRIIARQIE